MIITKKILPIRFYDNIFEQDRFNKLHDRSKDSPLVYPVNDLPHFQITRTSSLITPENFIIKKVCNEDDYYGKLVPEGPSNFETVSSESFFEGFPKVAAAVYDNGVDPPQGVLDGPVADIDNCNRLSNANCQFYTFSLTGDQAEIKVTTLGGLRHKLKLVVEKFEDNSAGFTIKVLNGIQGVGATLQTITAPGIYEIPFTAASTQVSIVFHNFQCGDIFSISHIQLASDPMSSLSVGDISLADGDLRILKKTDGEDIVAFCSNSTTSTIEPGDYYYVVDFGDSVYYSEVFTLKSLKEIEKYYLLTWWNTCDIGNVMYNITQLTCGFKNKLYLDAALFKPEYTTIVENITNGESEVIPSFKRWEKFRNIEIMKAPEFLADALSAIFLHDYVYLREPLNREQIFIGTAYQITQVSSDINPVLNDAYQRVVLKLLLSDNAVKLGCCDNILIVASGGGGGGDPFYVTGEGSYSLVIHEPPEVGDGLYDAEMNLVEVLPSDIIQDGSNYYSLELVEDIYIISRTYPEIISSVIVDENYVISGYAIPGTFVTLSTNKDGAGFIDTGIIVESDVNGLFSLEYPTIEADGLTTLFYRVNSSIIDFDFGDSVEFEQDL